MNLTSLIFLTCGVGFFLLASVVILFIILITISTLVTSKSFNLSKLDDNIDFNFSFTLCLILMILGIGCIMISFSIGLY